MGLGNEHLNPLDIWFLTVSLFILLRTIFVHSVETTVFLAFVMSGNVNATAKWHVLQHDNS